jgi:hypothetical protein
MAIDVELNLTSRRPNSEIARDAAERLESHIQIPSDEIKVNLRRGWVTPRARSGGSFSQSWPSRSCENSPARPVSRTARNRFAPRCLNQCARAIVAPQLCPYSSGCEWRGSSHIRFRRFLARHSLHFHRECRYEESYRQPGAPGHQRNPPFPSVALARASGTVRLIPLPA